MSTLVISELTQRKFDGHEIAIEHDMCDLIREQAETAGSYRSLADELGVSAVYLCDVMHGKRQVGTGLAKKLGFEKASVFVRRHA